jgi:hypothetical protein
MLLWLVNRFFISFLLSYLLSFFLSFFLSLYVSVIVLQCPLKRPFCWNDVWWNQHFGAQLACNKFLKIFNAHLLGIVSWWNFGLEYVWIFIHIHISYILLGGEGKEVPVHTMKLYDLYFVQNISHCDKISIWPGHAACMEDRRGVCRVLVRRLDGKRQLGTHMWERPTRCTLFFIICFTLIILLFQTSKCLLSGEALYKQLTAFHCAP